MSNPSEVRNLAISSAADAAIRTVSTAALGLEALFNLLSEPEFVASFEQLVERVAMVDGRVIMAGMGKSGLIARKIVATLTSTGTPAMFLHPAEAGHGDLGMITDRDIVLLTTYSGESAELAPIISYCRRFGIPIVVITSRRRSTAARSADQVIHLPPVREACPNALTPTTSTTVQLVFGDALAMALLELREFSADDFYTFHPSGRLGSLLLRVSDLMSTGQDIPSVAGSATLLDATIEMTRARFGGTAIVDTNGQLLGAFTDGDLRRTVTGGGQMSEPVQAWMTREPQTISPHELASEALRRMQTRSITMLFVVDEGHLAGVVHLHDVLQAGIA